MCAPDPNGTMSSGRIATMPGELHLATSCAAENINIVESESSNSPAKHCEGRMCPHHASHRSLDDPSRSISTTNSQMPVAQPEFYQPIRSTTPSVWMGTFPRCRRVLLAAE